MQGLHQEVNKAENFFCSERPAIYISSERIFGCLNITANVTFSNDQYEMMSYMIRSLRIEIQQITCKAIRGYQINHILSTWYLASENYKVGGVEFKASQNDIATCVQTHNEKLCNSKCCARVLQPWKWAELDIVTYPFYKNVYEQEEGFWNDNLLIASACNRREKCLAASAAMSVSYKQPCFQ